MRERERDIYRYIFFINCVCKHARYFFEREPAGKNITVELWSEWQDIPRAWCMLNSHCCTLYLPVIFCTLYTWLILYRRNIVWLCWHCWHCLFFFFFVLHRILCHSADLLVGLWVPPVSSAQQDKVDWRVRGQHLSVDGQKINLRKVH